MDKLKVLFITHHWETNSHQSKFGGYQQLVNFIPPEKIERTVLTWGNEDKEELRNGIKILYKKIPRYFKFFFKRYCLIKHAAVISRDYDIIHALYDDVAPFRASSPLIVTLHTTKNLHRKSIWLKLKFLYQKKVIKKAARVIVLSNNMRKILSLYIETERIKYIPHGIDTAYFKPLEKTGSIPEYNKRGGKTILCLGNYGTSMKRILSAAEKEKDCFFIIINNNWKIKPRENLLFFKRVSEKKLREIYTVSDVLFRPLEFSSANNSILEAISMGLFVLTNETEGVKDYLNKCNAIIDDGVLYNLRKYIPEMIDREKIMRSAEKFAWKKIVKDMLVMYYEIIPSEGFISSKS